MNCQSFVVRESGVVEVCNDPKAKRYRVFGNCAEKKPIVIDLCPGCLERNSKILPEPKSKQDAGLTFISDEISNNLRNMC